MKKILTLLVMIAVIGFPGIVLCQDDATATAAPVSRDALAKESEEFCAETAKDKPTADAVIKKVEEACLLVASEGRNSFSKFMGKESKFIFAGTYIWIHDLEGVMQMHPLKYKMEGKPLLVLKDKKGKRFFVEMNKVAQEKGAGWVDYHWPVPGSKDIQRKVSFVKLCETPEKEKFVVGCGIYGLSDAEIDNLVSSK